MAKLGRRKYRPTPSMNVTPLVDVVLVLLIIFMVVIPNMDKSAAIDLPSIFHADEEAKGKTNPFTLALATDGRLYFEQEELSPENMKQRLTRALEQEHGRRIVLRADQKAPYGKVRKLFKTCQEIGFPGVSLRVNELNDPKKPAKAP